MKRIRVLFLFVFTACMAGADRPNIIFFLADDQRDDVLGCYGNGRIQTPTIDRLAAEGIRFENSFCQVPICAGSRATLFSGLSQRTHGYNFGEPPVAAEYISTCYPAVLKDAGYRTGFAGKYGMRFEKPGLRPAFDFFREIGRNPYLKKMPDGSLRHETDLCADAAIEFIETNPKDTPFCMSVSFNASHAEDRDLRPGFHFQWPESADGLYEDVEMPAANLADRNYFEALPPFLQDAGGLSRERFFWRWDTPEKYRANMRAYYRMITGIDHAVARVLEALKARGLDGSTIVVYSADNGYMMGDRGIAGKWNHYEQSLRVPLIIHDPRLPDSKRGRVVQALVSNVDVAPTLVDMAGADLPEVYQGRSLLPLVRGETVDSWREDLFFEHRISRYNNWHGVRGKRYKYTVYYDDGYECLYDLQKDPAESVNLAANPEYAETRARMAGRLDHYRAAYPEPERKPAGKAE